MQNLEVMSGVLYYWPLRGGTSVMAVFLVLIEETVVFLHNARIDIESFVCTAVRCSLELPSIRFLFKGTSRQRSDKGAIRKGFPLQKPWWKKQTN